MKQVEFKFFKTTRCQTNVPLGLLREIKKKAHINDLVNMLADIYSVVTTSIFYLERRDIVFLQNMADNFVWIKNVRTKRQVITDNVSRIYWIIKKRKGEINENNTQLL